MTSPLPAAQVLPQLGTAGLDLFEHALQAGRTVVVPPPQNPCTSPAAPPPEALLIAAVLADRRGRDAAITAPRIAAAAGLWPDLRDADRGTKVRELIATWYETMLVDGYVLVATSDGYFLSDDPEDIAHYDHSLQGRLRDIGWRLHRVRLAARRAGFVYHGHGDWERR